eukprot:PhF_6_TR41091/c0_g1_i1/m.62247/K06999/K06999; phospholipase/carboxylesterase
MSHESSLRDKPYVFPLQQNDTPQCSVIFMHGLGGTGQTLVTLFSDLVEIIPSLKHVRFVFPNAVKQPVTMLGGKHCESWYDIIGDGRSRTLEPANGICDSVSYIHSLIDHEVDTIYKGDTQKVFLGGFSQGGTMTYMAGLTYSRGVLGGRFAFSGYVCNLSWLMEHTTEVGRASKLIQVHGDADHIVLPKYAYETAEYITATSMPASGGLFETQWVSGMDHELRKDVLVEVFNKVVVPTLSLS